MSINETKKMMPLDCEASLDGSMAYDALGKQYWYSMHS